MKKTRAGLIRAPCVCVPQCICVREISSKMCHGRSGVGDSKAHAVGVGPRQSPEGDLLGEVVPAEGLKLTRKNCLVQRDGML